MEQVCSFCGLKVANFPKLIDHHLKEHPSQINTLLQGKRKRKRKHVILHRSRESRVRSSHVNENGDVVSVKSAFRGDIIVTRLRNPAPQDTDISVLFLNLRRRIKDIFKKYYVQRGPFRWLIILHTVKQINSLLSLFLQLSFCSLCRFH